MSDAAIIDGFIWIICGLICVFHYMVVYRNKQLYNFRRITTIIYFILSAIPYINVLMVLIILGSKLKRAITQPGSRLSDWLWAPINKE